MELYDSDTPSIINNTAYGLLQKKIIVEVILLTLLFKYYRIELFSTLQRNLAHITTFSFNSSFSHPLHSTAHHLSSTHSPLDIFAIFLVALLAAPTMARRGQFCYYADACTKVRLAGMKHGMLIDECKSVFKIDGDCKLKFVGRIKQTNSLAISADPN